MRESPKRAPTLEDVALLAGVSHQTVSRVINNYPYIKAETHERVTSAIAQLGYRRNTVARSLATSRTGTIGVVATDLVHFGPASALWGVERAARDAGYGVSIVSIAESDAVSMSDALERLVRQAVEGIVVVAPENDSVRAARLSFSGVPIVSMSASAQHDELGVEIDTEVGARSATRHLIELGHVDIAHVAGPRGYHVSEAREKGWRIELAAAGLVARDPVVADEWTQASGYLAGKRLLELRPGTAVFVSNDELAQGLLLALHQAGLRVPDDVSVVGYDDGPAAAYCIPPLTTVRQDFDDLGRRSIDTLLAEIEHAERPGPTAPPAQTLIIRDSTAPPP